MNATAPNTATTASAAPAFTLEDVKRNFFTPAEFDKALVEISRIGQIPDVSLKSNVPLTGSDNALIVVKAGVPTLNVPDGFGVVITPIQERQKSGDKNVTVAVGAFIGILPTKEKLISTSADGEKLVTMAVANNLVTKVLNAIRPNKSGETGTPPVTVEEFIESGRTGPDLSAFKKYAPGFVDYFKSKGVSIMNMAYLRQAFQSKAFSVAQFGDKLEPIILKALQNMKAIAERQGASLELIDHWLDSRDNTAAFELADDVSFDDMAELIAEPANDEQKAAE